MPDPTPQSRHSKRRHPERLFTGAKNPDALPRTKTASSSSHNPPLTPPHPTPAFKISLHHCTSLLSICLVLLTGCHHPPPNTTTVTVLIETSPNTLDPRIATDAQGARISSLIFDSLIRKDDHFNLQPCLATSWDQPDPLTITFHLRPNVHFHNGRLFSSADVAFTLNSVLTKKIPSAKLGTLAAIASITTPDPLTVTLHLSHPDPSLLWNLTDSLNGIVPVGSGTDLTNHPIGTGPFRFVSQVDDKEVVLAANKNYWDTPPTIARAIFAVVPDETTRALELEKGSADIAINSLTEDTVAALAQNPQLAVNDSPGAILNYINMRVDRPPLNDYRVRQAIAYAINRPAILRALFHNHARLAGSMLPPGHWALAPQLAEYPHDPARARRLLNQAGYRPNASGVRLHLSIKSTNDETTRLLLAILQQQLRQVGIELTLHSYEFATFITDVTHGSIQLYVGRWIDSNEDPDIFRATLSSDAFAPHGANRAHYTNPVVDQLLAAAATAPDQQSRREDYIRIQQIVAEDMPEINLWYLDNVLTHTRRVTNLIVSPSGSYDFLRTAKIQ